MSNTAGTCLLCEERAQINASRALRVPPRELAVHIDADFILTSGYRGAQMYVRLFSGRAECEHRIESGVEHPRNDAAPSRVEHADDS
jgi:hypothetical protein